MDEDEQFEAWLEHLEDMYTFAVQDRLRELNGDRVSNWRKDGLHQWSHSWGILDALTPDWLMDLMAAEPELLGISPTHLRQAATADGTDIFVARITAREDAHPGAHTEGRHDL